MLLRKASIAMAQLVGSGSSGELSSAVLERLPVFWQAVRTDANSKKKHSCGESLLGTRVLDRFLSLKFKKAGQKKTGASLRPLHRIKLYLRDRGRAREVVILQWQCSDSLPG